MIPASLYLDVIQAERRLELERWQLVREARSAIVTPRVGLMARLRAGLDPRRWLEHPAPSVTSGDGVAMSAACC